ncbi:MAG: cadherin-like beta sandwich domain-containing protein, partial [Ignavibacteriales bacterium]
MKNRTGMIGSLRRRMGTGPYMILVCAMLMMFLLPAGNAGALPIILSSNADLDYIALLSSSLNESFLPSTTSYTANTSINNTSVSVKTSNGYASVTVNGTPLPSQTWCDAIMLTPGSNLITIIVTAQDGVTTKTYTVNLNYTPPGSSNANLSSIGRSTGGIVPAFAPATTSYSSPAPDSPAQLAATPEDSGATIRINGAVVASGAWSPAIPLTPGSNPINIVVTAADGVTTKTYTVNLTYTPPGSSNANLSSIGSSTGGIVPAFAPATTSYSSPAPDSPAQLAATPEDS